ncbi:hypothetical protein GQR58_029790 [Nymphon striatum]|nr:hypothetical protein GQR58_029790 [Nymphon striatum]
MDFLTSECQRRGIKVSSEAKKEDVLGLLKDFNPPSFETTDDKSTHSSDGESVLPIIIKQLTLQSNALITLMKQKSPQSNLHKTLDSVDGSHIDEYLNIFDRIADTEGWSDEDRLNILISKLTGRARSIFLTLPESETRTYLSVKKQFFISVPPDLKVLVMDRGCATVAEAARWLINELGRLGLSISYNEVTRLNQSVMECENTKYKIPGAFTMWVADNIDHTVATLDGKDTFHGMGIVSASTSAGNTSATINPPPVKRQYLKKAVAGKKSYEKSRKVKEKVMESHGKLRKVMEKVRNQSKSVKALEAIALGDIAY